MQAAENGNFNFRLRKPKWDLDAMTILNQIYKCNICGNMVEMIHAGAGQLVCCGQPMELKEEKTEDPEISMEKHVPVIEHQENGVLVKIGSIPHPMEDVHYIEWVEIETAEGKTCRKFLKPGDEPEILFHPTTSIVKVREYCNLHGLWVKEI